MVRLSSDEAAWQMGLRTMPLEAETHREIEAALQTRLIELVHSGSDVVLDFSFWSLKMREEYRRLLRPLGVEPETLYISIPREARPRTESPEPRVTRTTSDSARSWPPSILTTSSFNSGRRTARGHSLPLRFGPTGRC